MWHPRIVSAETRPPTAADRRKARSQEHGRPPQTPCNVRRLTPTCAAIRRRSPWGISAASCVAGALMFTFDVYVLCPARHLWTQLIHFAY